MRKRVLLWFALWGLIAPGAGLAALLPTPVLDTGFDARPTTPPKAPAHGHSLRRDGVELRFDAQLGVYVVSDRVGTYYFHDAFIRIHSGSWQLSSSPHGPWRPQRSEWVPLRLRAKHYSQEL